MNKLIFALSAVVLAASSQAVTAFNSFGPGMSYNSVDNMYLAGKNGPTGNADWSQAFKFTSAATGLLESFTFAVEHTTGTNTGFIIGIYTDSGNAPDSLVLEAEYGDGVGPGLETVVNPFPVGTLTAGHDYWLQFKTNSPDNGFNVFANDQGLTTTRLRDISGGSNWTSAENEPMMALDVQVVPEPMTMTVLGGLGALAALRRRKKQA